MQLLAHPEIQIVPRGEDATDATIIAVNPAARRSPGLMLVRSEGAVESRDALLNHLDRLGEVAPGAPLSFLVVAVQGLGWVDEAGGNALGILEAVGDHLASITRLTDITGRFTANTFGVILQGATAKRASSALQQLTHELQRLPGVAGKVQIEATVASGTGANAGMLPAVALDSLPRHSA